MSSKKLKKFIAVTIVIISFIILAGCAQKPPPMDDAYAEAKKFRIPNDKDWVKYHAKELKKFNEITIKQKEEIQKFINLYGRPPFDLKELEEEGLKVYEPYNEYYKWEYGSKDQRHWLKQVPDLSKLDEDENTGE